MDAKRRQNMANLRPLDSPTLSNMKQRESNLSDDEPLYDAVASDDDYAALAPIGQQVKKAKQKSLKNYSIGWILPQKCDVGAGFFSR